MGIWESFVYRLLGGGIIVLILIPLGIILLGWLLYMLIGILRELKKR